MGKVNKWWVYVLECGDGSFYTGITVDLDKRVEVHNAGKGAKYTRGRLPVVVVWKKRVESEGEARRMEMRIKKLKRKEKGQLISGVYKLLG